MMTPKAPLKDPKGQKQKVKVSLKPFKVNRIQEQKQLLQLVPVEPELQQQLRVLLVPKQMGQLKEVVVEVVEVLRQQVK